jgi:dTMP kinase
MKKHRSKHGLFITFEGSEGCGKSTQIKRLAHQLRRNGHRVFVTREPGGTPVSERIRHLLKFSKSSGNMTPEAELLLFSASRAQLVREKILPALSRGEIVLCDRFVDSTTVYQGVGRKLNLSVIQAVNEFAIANRKPDLTLVLDANVSTGLARAKKKTNSPDRMEAQKKSFYLSVQKGFRALAKKEPRRVKIIDATKSILEVSENVKDYVRPLLHRL